MFKKSNNPHELTEDEMLIKVLTHLKNLKDYWTTVKLDSERDSIEKRMDGLCFSFLSFLDGSSVDFPSFEVVPTPHPSDEDYLRNDGCDWWPNQAEKFKTSGIKSIATNHAMHELWHMFNRGEIELIDGKIKVKK